ncbi:hypothetical protein CN235_18020 [Sinorhizobium meliloti]|uniref:hypothetical protein n=1 Tax=Rhizobium meliloti TaxID=382 RepID=UPI000FD400CD|nr:hypothetical protein [Sinorhizobium meliloti]RVE92445.1 hypothetical protein CN235_18020 [Sinorhizobium meliloti]
MARRSTPCTQADLTRLLKAVLAAGVGVERIAGVKLTKDGAEVLFGEAKPIQNSSNNPWDEVLE